MRAFIGNFGKAFAFLATAFGLAGFIGIPPLIILDRIGAQGPVGAVLFLLWCCVVGALFYAFMQHFGERG
jgi:hypothetical protein